MNGRSEYPRRNPAATSIRSILKFPEQIDAPAKNAYDPPDVRNPFSRQPDGAVDYLNIVEMADFVPNMARIQTASSHGGQMNNERTVIANWRILPLFLDWDGPWTRARRHTSVMGATIHSVAKKKIVNAYFRGQMTTVEVSSSIVTAGG
jgi:hypothetical protein